MLIGMKAKVGNKSNHEHKDFVTYDCVIASEAQMNSEGDFMVAVLVDGKIVPVDTYYMYDVIAA